jgi:hypothetical protein
MLRITTSATARAVGPAVSRTELSRSFGRSTRIRQPHSRPVYSDDASVRAHELSDQQADREERRWHLEFARPNVED